MEDSSALFTHTFFLIFTGAALLASLALYTRQPILLAYIAIGAILGPYGSGLISQIAIISDISKVGIFFLLFLLGLDMQPQRLLKMMKLGTVIAIVSSIIFTSVGYGIAYVFGFTHGEALIIGLACMFSSTIIGIKLLPTTVLHHRRTGELMVGMLLLQDIIAVLILMAIMTTNEGHYELLPLLKALFALPILVGVIYLCVRLIILPLVVKFDRFHEYIFLLAIGWCMGCTELAHLVGLSAEIGAFVGGITLATSPIAQFIATNLRPLRDFFLVLFFFSLGAGFDFSLLDQIIWAVLALSASMLILKPIVFKSLLTRHSDNDNLAWDVGFRLGQISEFSLLIAFLALERGLIGSNASLLIQATAIVTFIISSYIVILNYPSPIAVSDRLRRD
ncbi:transporter (CPA2 family) [Sinobacterium caligoides]|uniref:Transporter (CPA2 family) n=1 Tax=Sinobacterium caligoides TaxID=933926 RepID=A0A3N2DK12_9GAMM|nr:cation:proton antiporter [Sinobacterium caligoides]ROS00012.1 transporter (CPA2 family) [Sinobacterium caligoides]